MTLGVSTQGKYLATSFEKVTNLAHWKEISHMGLASGCCSPVKLQISFGEDFGDLVLPQNLLEVATYEVLFLSDRQG